MEKRKNNQKSKKQASRQSSDYSTASNSFYCGCTHQNGVRNLDRTYYDQNSMTQPAHPSFPKTGQSTTNHAFHAFVKDLKGEIKNYERESETFCRLFLEWYKERESIIDELEKLADEVHENQLNHNKANLLFKSVNSGSKRCSSSNPDNPFATFAAIFTEVASTITSVSQAVHVDQYMDKLKKIMERDECMTKPLYKARSSCSAMYHGVEEIVREYHDNTFDTVISNISDTLKFGKLWMNVKCLHKNEFSGVFEELDNIMTVISKREVIFKIADSVQSYIDSNPATLDACKSAGKAFYTICSSIPRDENDRKPRAVAQGIKKITDIAIRQDDERDICRLQRLVLDDESEQAKIETKIRESIGRLKSELSDMRSVFQELRSHINVDSYNAWHGHQRSRSYPYSNEPYYD